MNGWAVFQLVLNLGLVAVGVAIFVRSKRPRKDDPRLSKGLQLLQSKIAILEDLSDRTDNQVKQLAGILDQKAKMVHEHAEMIQQHLNLVEKSIERSMEVSRIFQDKIPHKEIIERQNTIKYIQAARMAHQGQSVEEISQKVDIPKSELDFIAKVNKDRLMFSEKDLPSWAMDALQYKEPVADTKISQSRDMTSVYEGLTLDKYIHTEDKKIESDFKQSIQDYRQAEQALESAAPEVTATQIADVLEAASEMEASSQIENNSNEIKVEGLELNVALNQSSNWGELKPTTPEEHILREESALVQKIGALVEKKLGFSLDTAEPKKSNFQLQNESAVKNTNQLKKDIARQTITTKQTLQKTKDVKPFVFKKIDKGL